MRRRRGVTDGEGAGEVCPRADFLTLSRPNKLRGGGFWGKIVSVPGIGTYGGDMIRLGIVGYGNLGRACERIAASKKDTFELVGIFTRRDPAGMTSPFGTPFYGQDEIEKFAGKIDVLALCTGSANDLTDLGKRCAAKFNTVDSFDTHARMREYVADMQAVTEKSGTLALIGIGWDPGLFSLMRAVFGGVLENGNTQTFWGKGVSQGHSEAIRKIDGVRRGVQYTIPKEEALVAARAGRGEGLTTRDKHLRECFVVAADGADKAEIERRIVTMPNYFDEYDTVVHFISEEEFERDHTAMPHGGFVLRGGSVSGKGCSLEFALKLESNPDFTASVLMAYAAASARLYAAGRRGALTILDIPAVALTDEDRLDYIAHTL